MEKYNFGEDENYLLSQNLVGAKDFEMLTLAEQYAFTVRALQFEQGGYKIEQFNLNTLIGLHQHLFQDIYQFAGKIRDVQLVKGTTRFCQMQFIGSELIRIFDELAHESDWLNVEDAVIRLAYYKSELNIIHPFREGNGRTIRLFIHALALSRGFDWQYSDMDKEQYMNAMIQSVFNTKSLEQLFRETVTTI